MPPPTSRRTDRAQPGNRSRMYNLAGHAHSSGSLLPRSTDVHAASTSASTSAAPLAAVAPTRGVDATDAPYLTNLESHFGRVTLTAPDNLLRKQAKEKKQKIRQRKAQNAQAAAVALAGASQPSLPISMGRNAVASSSNLLDSSRRYQTTLDDAATAVSTGLLVPPSGQYMGMRRAYSGGQTPTLASTSQTPPSTSQTVIGRTRRRRPSSGARDDPSSRPASRASGPSRPDSALSLNDADASQPEASHSDGLRPPRSRTESAPAVQRRSHNAFDTAPAETVAETSAHADVPASTAVPPTSLHRQNVWNDITEADPDDLPPPFPVGAPRPPTPERPPGHSEAANDAQLIGPQPHARIPDSPPPPFVSDDEDEAVPAVEDSPSRRGSPQPGSEPTIQTGASHDRPASRASTPSSASISDDESIELTEERRAWEADIRNGLSFEVRVLREQQRRVARERAMALRTAQVEEEGGEQAAPPHSADETAGMETATESAEQGQQTAVVQQDDAMSAARVPPDNIVGSEQVNGPANTVPVTELANRVSMVEMRSDAHLAEAESTVEATEQQLDAAPPTQALEPPNNLIVALPNEPIQSLAAPANQLPLRSVAPEAQPSPANATTRQADTSGRLMLANEPRLGLPSTSAPSRPTSSPIAGRSNANAQPSSTSSRRVPAGHRKTNSDTPSSVAGQMFQRTQAGHRAGSNGRASLSSLAARRLIQGQTVRGHDSDSSLPLSRRPEDTLFVISAPPPATYGKALSDEEASAQQPSTATTGPGEHRDDAVPDVASGTDASDDDEGAESDSSIEQWLAESAAFDALRKREEEAAARLQALREPPVSDSDEDDAAMPGAFSHRPAPHSRQSSAVRKVPDPANLALMDQALPRAPPPLVLGRSRGGAAYSDSSSDSTDTDDALDQYSSSDEDDEQHRAFYEARAAETNPSDPFINSHRSVHVRNTSSAPNLSIVDDSEDKASDTAATPAVQARNVVQQPTRASIATPKTSGAQALPSQPQGPTRSLSIKAQGKLPERIANLGNAQSEDQRAGEFEEDTSSSRDLSYDDENAVEAAKEASSAAPPFSDSSSLQRKSNPVLPGLGDPAKFGVRRSSLDPLLQPLGYGPIGRNDLKDRLKGLFGQQLVADTASQPSSGLQAGASKPAASAFQASAASVEARQSLGDSRRLSARSLKAEGLTPMEAQVGNKEAAIGSPPVAQASVSKGDDAASMAPSRAPSSGRQLSAGSQSIADKAAEGVPTQASSSASRPPEQRARDEALLQIAQLSASTQSRQDSLAALERLLAKTGRPTSMLPPNAITRAELGGRLQLTSDVPDADAQKGSEAEQAFVAPTPSVASNRLSRQGAIVRGRGPLPSPPSALSRASSSATRPVSFVNPRSSAAPLPRGRLPAITDATRHFPPSASSLGPGVAPSWLSYIPSEERERLPVPLEPQRATAPRATGGKVSDLISRFEAAPSTNAHASSPTKQSGSFASNSAAQGVTRTNSNRSIGSVPLEGGESRDGGEDSGPAVYRRFSSNNGDCASGEGRVMQRRPPPPPPPSTLPTRRSDTNHFRLSETADRSTSSTSSVTQSASMEALARQIDQAASEWSVASLHDHIEQQRERRQSAMASQLAVPATAPSALASPKPGGASSSGLPRSPRTQAMDTLTGRVHIPGASTPPSLPPKSPLITPEQILASASRNGLSASIAAAQAAAFARRDGRESRTHSASSSMDTSASRQPDWVTRANGSSCEMTAAAQGSRPLPSLPASLRMQHGLGISGDGGASEGGGRRELPVPPPLPTRPRGRDWESLGSGSGTKRTQEARTEAPLDLSSTGTAPNGAGTAESSIDTLRSSSTSRSNGHSNRSVGRPELLAGMDPPTMEPSDSHRLRDSSSPLTPASPMSPATSAAPMPSAGPAAAELEPLPSTSSSAAPPPRRAPSLGLTDFDLLVASLESQPSNYESLSAIGEFLGPARPAAASAAQLASLSVALVECDSRRITKQGKIKQKLSCVGVRVDKCTICLSQFRERQRAVLLPRCGHIFHEECLVGWLRRDARCPSCRQVAV